MSTREDVESPLSIPQERAGQDPDDGSLVSAGDDSTAQQPDADAGNQIGNFLFGSPIGSGKRPPKRP